MPYFAENSSPKVGFKPKNGSSFGAQAQLLPIIPAVNKHGVNLASERCPVPSQDVRTTLGERPIFTNTTPYMAVMPQQSEVPTYGPHHGYAAPQGQARGLPRLNVTLPPQQANRDELNTPVIESENLFNQEDMVATPLEEYSTGLCFNTSEGINSQDLFESLSSFQPVSLQYQDPLLSSSVTSSQNSQPDQMSLNLRLTITNNPQVDTTTPLDCVQTPEIFDVLDNKTIQAFNLLDYVMADEPEPMEEDPLAVRLSDPRVARHAQSFQTPKPEHRPSPQSSPGMLVMNAPSPDSTSPASVQCLDSSPGSNLNGSSDYGSDLSYKHPGNRGRARAGPSKRSMMEDEGSSIPSSANELKLLENRSRNNAASRKSRMNKRSKDDENAHRLALLEAKHRELTAKATSLENIRNGLRARALAKFKGK
ncbi:Hypothetical predicted protein [Cloeon dipterum]|uniref:BZIP domain-containing protein n=1 Tax=Cloeon dipterum TaxID=197152 RepID=A0A8S1DLX4_9INSE|nr:Hypothetical predicted protein [Cloeon dipterum]